MDKELLDSLMKLQGVSIEYTCIDDDKFQEFWTFIIKGLSPIHSVGQMYGSEREAHVKAETIVYNLLTQGE